MIFVNSFIVLFFIFTIGTLVAIIRTEVLNIKKEGSYCAKADTSF